MPKTRKTKVRVVLKPSDLEDIQNLYVAINAMRGGLQDGKEFTKNAYVWVTPEQRYPVFVESHSGIIGWFLWGDETHDDLIFHPNKYIEVFVDDDEV